MNFQERNSLCNGLTERGFKPAAPSNDGWGFIHDDGVIVWFAASGQYRLTIVQGNENQTRHAKAVCASDILALVDEAFVNIL